MKNNDIDLTLFELLKKTRENQKLTLKEISQKSRISIKYLEALELGNYKEIPSIYDKLFFQTYLSFLNIENKDKILDEYNVIRGEGQLPEKFTDIEIKNDGNFFNHIKKIYFILPALVLIIIVIILAMYTKQDDDQGMLPVKELTVKDVVEEINKKELEEIVAAQSIKDSLAGKEKVSVDIFALEKTWIRVIKDHKDTTEYMLILNDKIVISADSVLTFLIGNANGLKMTVNGKDEGKIGNKGEIITFMKVTPKGIVAKNIKQPIKGNKVDTLQNN